MKVEGYAWAVMLSLVSNISALWENVTIHKTYLAGYIDFEFIRLYKVYIKNYRIS